MPTIQIPGCGPNSPRGVAMQIYSGRPFYVDVPSPDDIHINDIAEALSKMCRYNGHCKGFYSVAEHSVLVAKLVPPELRFQALMHDATEAYLGDIVRPIKHRMGAYRDMEEKLHGVIADKYGLPRHIDDAVHAADLMAIAIEKRDILNAPIGDFWGDLPEPRGDVRAIGMEWSCARRLFLDAFKEFSGEA